MPPTIYQSEQLYERVEPGIGIKMSADVSLRGDEKIVSSFSPKDLISKRFILSILSNPLA
jgi:hypothetical protein